MADNASDALASSATVRPIFNFEEEVVVIHNGWTPKKKIHGYATLNDRRKVTSCVYSLCLVYGNAPLFTKNG